MKNPMTEHPNSIGESYSEHMLFASRKSLHLLVISVALMIHAFLPFLFVEYASCELKKLNRELEMRGEKCGG